MWALVEDNSIVKIINTPQSIVIGDTRHSRKIFELWSEEELNNVGLYSIVFDNSNKQDAVYYDNTNQSFDFSDGVATASYGSPTAKELDDVTDEDDNVTLGLKSQKKVNIKQQARGLLTPTDWYVIKATDVESYSVPSAVTTFRANVRTASNDMETLIDACSTVDELAALYVYNDDTPPIRPLGEFPTLEI